jgi:hypothetical protein
MDSFETFPNESISTARDCNESIIKDGGGNSVLIMGVVGDHFLDRLDIFPTTCTRVVHTVGHDISKRNLLAYFVQYSPTQKLMTVQLEGRATHLKKCPLFGQGY